MATKPVPGPIPAANPKGGSGTNSGATKPLPDGINFRDRLDSLRAGVDVELTYLAFHMPGVSDPNKPIPRERTSYFGDVPCLSSEDEGKPFSSPIRQSPDYDGDTNTDSYNRVRKIIFNQAIRYNVTKLEQKFLSFNDIVDIDDEAFENHVSEDLAARFGESDFFSGVILLVILLNAITVAVQTNDQLAQRYSNVFVMIDEIFLAIFTMEILFKWYYGFMIFWKSGWNVGDFIIVLTSFLTPGKLSFGLILRLLRVSRAFRSLRYISILDGVQTVVIAIVDSIPDMANITVLLVALMMIWAIVGVTLFGDVLPGNFGDIGSAMFTLFIMTTQIGWMESFTELENDNLFLPAALYYASFMIIGVFVFMKIIVAVVVSNLEETYERKKKEYKRKYRHLKSNLRSTQGKHQLLHRFQRGIVNMPSSRSAVWKNQIPYEIPEFDKITISQLESYFQILSIMEENLHEYVMLKEKLYEIQVELKLINSTDGVNLENEEEDEEYDDGGGDVLSKWLKAFK
ncbi:uncharacterized protein BJ171DRAFT_609748 [Polychytrium aggregatum]|uniref:uncharacterized protein n=1 Tax=Polychytrium aggregatum TaxID=110093 RepID=UPI0022FDEC89|nr:uncharacterized protein BJ171DRAFT_609748 [Polychytrium aggregatum]KAI9206642.1 hypothetical protein BJ171DRAFT_609748 [Polychytrium aggregatum]